MGASRCPGGDAAHFVLAMPVLTTDALILRTYHLGEADRIVVFLTPERGKKRGVANGARSPRSRRFAGGLEPLTAVRLAYYEREHRDLVRLRYVEPVRSPMSARDGERLGYVEYFAEILDECAQEAEPNAPLFRLGSAVGALLAGEIPIARLARYFEYWVLRLQGVYPSLNVCGRCGRRPDRGGRYRRGGRRLPVRRVRRRPGPPVVGRGGAVSPRRRRDAAGRAGAGRVAAARGPGTRPGPRAPAGDASREGAAGRQGVAGDGPDEPRSDAIMMKTRDRRIRPAAAAAGRRRATIPAAPPGGSYRVVTP